MSTTTTTLQAQQSFSMHTVKRNPIELQKLDPSRLAPQHDPTPLRFSLLSISSSNSSDSLVSALSKFPTTPGKVAPQLHEASTCKIEQDTEQEMQRPSSYSSSSAGSEDTLVPASQPSRVASDSAPPKSSAPPAYKYHVSLREGLETDTVLTAPRPMAVSSFGSSIQFNDQHSVWPVHCNQLGDVSEANFSVHANDLDAVLSGVHFRKKKHPRSTKGAAQQPPKLTSPDRLRALMQQFESGLSLFRSSALELIEELEVQLDGSQSKLDDLLLASIRRAATQGLEAMIMVSWFRETKLEDPSSAKYEANLHHSAERPHGKAQGSLQNTSNVSAGIESNDPAAALGGDHRKFSAVEADVPQKEVAGIEKSTRRNGFESPTRDPIVTSPALIQRNEKHLRPQKANASLSPALSIEDLAKARSCTPLHFNRPASPFVPSQRRWQAHSATAATPHNVVVADSRHMGCTAKTRCQSFSNSANNGPTVEAQVKSIRRFPSLHVGNLGSERPKVPGTEHELASKFEQLIQFPSAGPSPPTSPACVSASEISDTIRQPKQSLKSLRNFKISLRHAYKDSALSQNAPVHSPAVPAPEQPHLDSHNQLQPAQASQVMQRNVSDPIPRSAQSSYVRALIPVSQRPLSLAYSGANTAVLPAMKLSGVIKPLTQIHRESKHGSAPSGTEEKDQGGRKLSLRSLWRVFSG